MTNPPQRKSGHPRRRSPHHELSIVEATAVIAMSSEADRFRVELERLKSKYKREALRAIATATEEAYERGRKDERASQSGPAESGDDENRKQRPTALVQYVVEHIYRGLKDELADDAQLSIAKLKVWERKFSFQPLLCGSAHQRYFYRLSCAIVLRLL